MLIGVVGMLSAGKTTVVDMLHKKGFKRISLSDVLREKALARGQKTDRNTLYSIANECRTKFGPASIMQEVINRMEHDPGNYAIDAIRNLSEVELLRAQPDDVFILGVDADFNTRFERAQERQKKTGREENAATKEEFQKREAREDLDDPNRPQLSKVLATADVVIKNDGTLQELRKKVTAALKSFKTTHRSSKRKS